MKNAMQLKAFVKKYAEEHKISPQAVMQNYMLERLLERISKSKYQYNFILKGGMLISSVVGLDTRTTMDMDGTLKSFPLNEETAREIFSNIVSIDLEDGVSFELTKISPIRKADEYGGFQLSITARYETLNVQLKIDLTTGDKITPREIKYQFYLLFSDKTIEVLAYNLETVLAEKYETIIRRSIANTRIRDFYDVYVLLNFQSSNINFTLLKEAIHKTAEHRNSLDSLELASETIDLLTEDKGLQDLWTKYQDEFEYAKGIEWSELIDTLRKVEV